MTSENATPTVLLVDDEEEVVEVFSFALDEYDVRTAYGGEEALDTVDADVDVVLLDRRMPAVSGDEVLEEMRRRELDVRVAMVTAVDPDFDIAEMPFDSYVTKPASGEEVRAAVDELLALSTFDDTARELFTVAEKKAALQAEKTTDELADNAEYDQLRAREAELDRRAADSMDEVETAQFEKLLSFENRSSTRE